MQADPEALYRRYGGMVMRRCRRMLGDEERARDAMQDVFVQVVRYRERLDERAASSLLWAIATRVCLNHLRAARRRPERLADLSGAGAEGASDDALLAALAHAPDEAERTGARALLARLFGGEPASSRVIAVMHYLDGMTLEETAAEVGLSVSGVRKRLRALRDKVGGLAAAEEARR